MKSNRAETETVGTGNFALFQHDQKRAATADVGNERPIAIHGAGTCHGLTHR